MAAGAEAALTAGAAGAEAASTIEVVELMRGSGQVTCWTKVSPRV
jgi:hypothetical protein